MAFVLSHDKSIRVTGVNGGVGNNRRNRVMWPMCSGRRTNSSSRTCSCCSGRSSRCNRSNSRNRTKCTAAVVELTVVVKLVAVAVVELQTSTSTLQQL